MYISTNFTPKPTYFSGRTNQAQPKSNQINGLVLGSLLTLATLASVPSFANTEYRQNRTEIVEKKEDIISQTAKKMNLSSTPNKKVYYDDEKGVYYFWDGNKKSFDKAKHITNVYKTGYIKTKKGEYLDSNGKPFIIKDLGKYLIPVGGGYRGIGRALAVVHGYEQSSIVKNMLDYNIKNNQQLEVYYDKDNKKYLRWNNDKKAFENSPVTEVCGVYFTENQKRYKVDYNGQNSKIIAVTEKDYQANKQGLKQFTDKDVYVDNTPKYGEYYYWDTNNSKFIKYGYNVDVNNMLTQKADGKIGNFRQGDMGDCWLLSVINSALHHPDPFIRAKFTSELDKLCSVDANNNITVHLKGVNKKYKITKEEIDSVITKNNHYAIGEREVVAIEMAMEQYKRSLGGLSSKHYTNTFNLRIPPENKDPEMALDGGSAHNAIHIMFGKEAHVAQSSEVDGILRIDNRFSKGILNDDFLNNKLMNNMVLLSYKGKNDDEAHIVSLYGVDKDNIYVIDSNIPDTEYDKSVKPKAIPKEKLYNELLAVTYTDLSVPLTKEKTDPIKAKYYAPADIKPLLPKMYFQ